MACVCGNGTRIPLLNLQSHSRQSSLFPKSKYPLQIHCKNFKILTKPPSAPVQPISSIPRRQLAVPLLGLSLFLNFSQPAQAQDIPFFGIKLKKVEEEVAKEAQKLVKEGEELVKEGEQGAEKVAEEVKEIAQGLEATASPFEGPAPLLQAGLVAGAEFVGVLVASSVVNNIVGPEPTKFLLCSPFLPILLQVYRSSWICV